MSFDAYGSLAGNIANQYGLNQSIFFGLIDVESNWNPYADNPYSSAYGFTQLLKGTASDLGVNRFDPTANLHGGAEYLSNLLSQFGGDYRLALSGYYSGPGNAGDAKGLAYADKVIEAAKKYGGTAINIGRLLAGDPSAAGNIFSDFFGGGQDSCGLNPICYLRTWIEESSFFQRLALATLALLFVLGALFMMKGNS